MSKLALLKAGMTPKSAAAAKPIVAAPEILEYDMVGAPSILVIGASGTGKTTGITQMLEKGVRVLLIDIEDKTQAFRGHRPPTVAIGEPVVEKATGAKRPPTDIERYQRLLAFRDKLANGGYRDHKGVPFDIVAGDGLMEAMQLIAANWRKNMPRAESTGSKDTFAMYDRIGTDGLDLLRDIKRAAAASAHLYGWRPLGMYWTCGEQLLDNGMYVPQLPGKQTGNNLPYPFEAVFRLAVRDCQHVMYLRGEEGRWFAKSPDCFGGVNELASWNMGDVYKQLVEYYTSVGGVPTENKETT